MYIGGGMMIHAPHTGDVVKISKLTGSYATRYVGAARPYGLGPPIVFPVVGKTQYANSFNATPKGLLPGNDIIATRKSLAVAAEPLTPVESLWADHQIAAISCMPSCGKRVDQCATSTSSFRQAAGCN